MTDRILEQASAFSDGELSDAEAALFVARLGRDPQLRSAVGRYEIIGEALRGTLPSQRRDFAAGVMAGIESDDAGAPEYYSSRRKPLRQIARFGRPVAGAAVAASVAMLAILTLQGPAGLPGMVDAPTEVVPSAGSSASNPVMTARQVDFSNVRSPELQNQLRGYLMNHNEHTGNSRLRGVMPYVQIAAQDSRPVNAADDTDNSRSNGGALPNDPQF